MGRSCATSVCSCPGGGIELACEDGADEDCDGATDCADPDCDARACGAAGRSCAGGACACPGGATETACADGVDGDCDGSVDCADADCAGRSCGAGGLVCAGTSCVCGAAPEVRCDNGVDDDCDGSIDCRDSDCRGLGCDDGSWCNGADFCRGVSCSDHPTPACATLCSEMTRTCVACLGDADCGGVTYGPWTGCTYAAVCDETNGTTESRDVTSPVCVAGMCGTAITTETRACARDTDGTTCGTGTYGPWGPCIEFDGTCDESGLETRSASIPTCTAGACVTVASSQVQVCTRDTDGTSCGTPACGSYGSCGGFSSTCDTSGTQSRTCSDYACMTGTCHTTSTTESRSCTRSTTGTTCAATTYGTWSACSYSNTCDESASQSRAVTTYTCGSGSCGSSSSTQSRACTRDTDGLACGRSGCPDRCVAGTCEANCAPGCPC
jgi:hypothetical protein